MLRISVALTLSLSLACARGMPEPLPPEPSAAPSPAPAPTPADDSACPDGVHAAAGWPGEYPGPIVDVTRSFVARAVAEPCARATFDCAVPAGIYHPWSSAPVSDFVTVRAIERWEATAKTELEGVPVDAGEVVELVQVLGEGFCAYRVRGAETTGECPGIREVDPWKKVGGADVAERELFLVACEGGPKGWVEANEALLARDEVREGTVLDYGTVGPGSD